MAGTFPGMAETPRWRTRAPLLDLYSLLAAPTEKQVVTVVARIGRCHEPEATRAVTHDNGASRPPGLRPRRSLDCRDTSSKELTDGSRDLFRLLEQDHVASAIDLSHLAPR